MKRLRKILFTIILFFLYANCVNAAADWRVGTVVCDYKKDNEKITITYYNVSAASGSEDPYYTVTYNDGKDKYCMHGESMISKCPKDTKPWSEFSEIYNYDSVFKYDNVNFYSIKYRLIRREYREDTNFDPKTLCSKAVLIDDIQKDGTKEVILCETNDTLKDKNASTACNYSSSKLFTLDGKTAGINTSAGSNDPNFEESYINNKEDIEKYCEEGSSTYDKELCEEAKKDSDLTVNTAEENGQSEEELEEAYQEYLELQVNIDMDFDVDGHCESYLGNPKDDQNKPPAYYLQFVFNLMKYAAILMLLGFTIMEYTKATSSNSQDAVKKATSNTIKRLIIAIIIFLLPMLIEFIFTVLGIYSGSTCGIS